MPEKKPLNILLLIHRFDFGGAENHVCDLANALCKERHKVFVVSRKGRQQTRLSKDVNFVKFRFRDFMLPIHLLWLIGFVLRHRIDVIHTHQRLPVLIGSLAGWVTRRRVVATVHGRARYDLRHFLSRRFSQKIIFVSKAVMHYGLERFNIAHKSVFIPNGLIPSNCECDPAKQRLFFAGKINKSHLCFLEMMIREVLPGLRQSFPGLELIILGDGRKMPQLQDLVDEINDSPGKDICTVRGYTPDVAECYSTASLVIGVGRVAMEAAGAGIPVLISNSKRMGGMLSVEKYNQLKDYNFVAVEAGPPVPFELADVITDFCQGNEFWKSEAMKVKQLILSDFGMDKVIAVIIRQYQPQ